MGTLSPIVEVQPTATALTRAAAERVVATAVEALRARGRFTIALSGGSTPRALYHLLATPAYASRIDWSRVQVFWGDERCVPPDDPASNYRMAEEALLSRVQIPAAQIHRIRGEDDPTQAAVAYHDELAGTFSGGGAPGFDLVLLGLGDEGHTASLFPGSAALAETSRWAAAAFVPKLGAWRVTLTPVAINAAAVVLFLVAGPEKAAALRRVLQGPRDPAQLPAQVVAPERGQVIWLADVAAAAALTGSRGQGNVHGRVEGEGEGPR